MSDDEPRPRKPKGDVDWGAPRYHQDARNRSNRPKQPSARHNRNYCKRLKGPHEYGPEKPYYGASGRILWYERRCTGCGRKQHTRFLPPGERG